MRKKDYKGRCEKKTVSKCKDICRLYDKIQIAYVDILQADEDITEIRCNVVLDTVEGGIYTTDFVCVKKNRDLLVRECVQRNKISKPMTVRLLDISREYWLKHGVTDWGIVTDAEE